MSTYHPQRVEKVFSAYCLWFFNSTSNPLRRYVQMSVLFHYHCVGVCLLYNVCLTCKMSWVLALFLTCDCFPGDQNTCLGIKQFNVVS